MSEENQNAGAPAWVMTFADLMSLLMCFFVLLLSFSEMDVQKYRQIAGSMQNAFGIQREIKAREIPKGTSIIAKEFSPGKPEPTSVKEIRQKTTQENKKNIEMPAEEGERLMKLQKQLQQEKENLKENLKKSKAILKNEIEKGQLKVETRNKNIIISINEKGSFNSASSELQQSFLPVIAKIRRVLIEIPGQIAVSGHTDDLPILTDRFRSNWELSSARAASAISSLLKHDDEELDPNRFVVHGYAETKPVASNDTETNRAKNRRVEIVIIQGGTVESHISAEDNTKSNTEETLPPD